MKNAAQCALLVVMCVCTPAPGAAPTFDVTIAAGAHDRHDTPVRIPLRYQSSSAKPQFVRLTGPDGTAIPAQLTLPRLLATEQCGCEVHFILPHLKAGESLPLTATITSESPPAEEGFAWHDHPGDHADLVVGSRPVLTYYYHPLDETSASSRERTYKVFHNLFSPRGDRVVTNGLPPDDPTTIHSPHHRGLFIGFNDISYGDGKTANLWACTNGAYQEHDRFLSAEAGPVLARHHMVIRWHGEDKQPFIEEERELTAYNVPAGRLFEFASRLKSLSGPVRLDGDPQHAGFQFRAHNDVDAKTSRETIYIRTDGVGKPGETRNWDPQSRQGPVNLPWNGMSFVLDGQRYTAAYLDHPRNPKDALFSEREFGRFGSFFGYTIKEDHPLNIAYRVWLQEGLMMPEQIAALSSDFVEPVEVNVSEL